MLETDVLEDLKRKHKLSNEPAAIHVSRGWFSFA